MENLLSIKTFIILLWAIFVKYYLSTIKTGPFLRRRTNISDSIIDGLDFIENHISNVISNKICVL